MTNELPDAPVVVEDGVGQGRVWCSSLVYIYTHTHTYTYMYIHMQRYFRQLVSSVAWLQAGLLVLLGANVAHFYFLAFRLRWQVTRLECML